MAASMRHEVDGHIAVFQDDGPSYTYANATQVRAFLETYHALEATFPGTAFTLAEDATILSWPGTPPDPVATRAAYLASLNQQAQDTAALRQAIRDKLVSSVGVRVDDLLVGQMRALLAYLLWREGALDKDGRVRPISEWTK